MKVKVIKQFKDKTTADNIQDQTLLVEGQIIECDDELAKSRIALGLVEEVKSDSKTSIKLKKKED